MNLNTINPVNKLDQTEILLFNNESQVNHNQEKSIEKQESNDQLNSLPGYLIQHLATFLVNDCNSLRINKRFYHSIDQNKDFLLQEMILKRRPITKIIDFLDKDGKSIQELDLSKYESQITPAQFELMIQKCPNIHKLYLNHQVKIINDSLKNLKQLKNLTELALVHCSTITDEGLKQLQFVTKLVQINLTGCFKITDEGLLSLKGLKNLRQIDLKWCEYINEEGCQLFQQSHPNLQINNFETLKRIKFNKRKIVIEPVAKKIKRKLNFSD